ncbi:MAG TPA: hypothetical protein VEC99_13645, partial [Clostridia bacterium]|nr:hypothetical protein [Clostridia bacterium]
MSNPDQAAERYNQSLRTVELLFDASKSHSFPRLTVIVAHPDDEVIGAGAQLPRWKKAQLVQVTD